MTIRITGAEALQARLSAWRSELGDRINDAVSAAGDDVVIRAKARLGDPGALADSIEKIARLDGVDVVAAADFARFVEFGTRLRPARPFLLPALRAARQALRDHLRKELP